MKSKTITEDNLLQELRKFNSARTVTSYKGTTVDEIAIRTGSCHQVVRRKLRELMQLGKAQMIKEYRPTIAGYNKRTPVYMIK